jgi:hypothetical protein
MANKDFANIARCKCLFALLLTVIICGLAIILISIYKPLHALKIATSAPPKLEVVIESIDFKTGYIYFHLKSKSADNYWINQDSLVGDISYTLTNSNDGVMASGSRDSSLIVPKQRLYFILYGINSLSPGPFLGDGVPSKTQKLYISEIKDGYWHNSDIEIDFWITGMNYSCTKNFCIDKIIVIHVNNRDRSTSWTVE